MPTIVAICPYCRAGGVRAKDAAVGASATCPKCKSSFTLMPEDDLPAWAAKANAAAFTAPTAEKPKLPAVEEPRAAARPAVADPLVSPPEPKPPVSAAPLPAATYEAPARAPADLGLVLGLVALILVGPAVLASQLPFGRIVALVLAATGFVAGLLALGDEGRARLAGAPAAALHFVALVVLLFLPSWLNLDPWRDAVKVAEPRGPVAVDHTSGARGPLAPDGWLDAGKHSWKSDRVRVRVRAAAVGPVELFSPTGAKRTTKEHYFHLVLEVSNVGLERDVPLSGWASGAADGAGVTDAAGKPLAPAAFGAGWAPARGAPRARLAPGHSAEVYFVFAAPPAKADSVRVRLSGGAVEAQEEIRFRAGVAAMPARGTGN